MFSLDKSLALKDVITKLNGYPEDVIKQSNKNLDLIAMETKIIIQMGPILSKVLILNGIPKGEFIKILNRTYPYFNRHKEKSHDEQVLTDLLNALKNRETYLETNTNMRKVLFFIDTKVPAVIKWFNEKSENLVEELTKLNLNDYTSLDIEDSCLTICILVWKFNDIFQRYYHNFISYLIMIIHKSCQYLQDYVDLRNKKYKESYGGSDQYDSNNESVFHFPLFRFPTDKCLNRLLSFSYFTLAFCFDCITSVNMILYLLNQTVNLPEISRLYLVHLIYNVIILTIDSTKCKTDANWADLPLLIHNQLIKFYVDRNEKIRNLIKLISDHIKSCSVKKLPIISQPIMDTVDTIIRVMEKQIETSEGSFDDLNRLKKVLNLDKSSEHSSILSASETTGTDEENEVKSKDKSKDSIDSELKIDDSFIEAAKSIKKLRSSYILPDLNSLIGLTKMRKDKEELKLKKSKHLDLFK